MLTGAKLTLKRLFYDDSGVAIAYTVMASLFIFMLCVSVYAMSENIRRKMELQNACDAAAYSGAVVQADMLSRIAVLNRALSWTYMQTGKRQMDYIISQWIQGIDTTYSNYKTGLQFSVSGTTDYTWKGTKPCNACLCTSCNGTGKVNGNDGCKSCNGSGKIADCQTCNGTGSVPDEQTDTYPLLKDSDTLPLGVPAYHRCVHCAGHGEALFYEGHLVNGWFMGWDTRDNIKINNNDGEVPLTTLNSTRSIVQTDDFSTAIINGRSNIRILNSSIAQLVAMIDSSIGASIEKTLSQHLGDSSTARCAYFVDDLWKVQRTDGSWASESRRNASYIIDERNEERFLNFSDGTAGDFKTGYLTWWDNKSDPSGIKRGYENGFLVAKFRYWASLWAHNPWTGTPHFICKILDNDKEIRPEDYLDDFFASESAAPVILARSFWGRSGSIVVSVKRRMVNPFQFFDSTGFYGAFNGLGRDMWVVSAARAGIKLNLERTNGRYEVRYPGDDGVVDGYRNGVWNLCEEDWDAVMLPVARAWNNTAVNAWGSQSIDTTTSNLLNSARAALGVRTPYTTPVPASSYNPFNPGAVKK